MSEFFHSVTLDREMCHGCINCVKRCPTEAIRVRDGKAQIISRSGASTAGSASGSARTTQNKPIYDPLAFMDQYEYTDGAARPEPVRPVQQSGRHRSDARRAAVTGV